MNVGLEISNSIQASEFSIVLSTIYLSNTVYNIVP